MIKYTKINTLVSDGKPLNYLILKRHSNFLCNTVYGYLVDEDDIDYVNGDYTNKNYTFKYSRTMFGTKLYYGKSPIGKIKYNFEDAISVEYDDSKIEINKTTGILFVTIKEVNKNLEFKGNKSLDYQNINVFSSLNSTKNTIIKSNDTNILELLKVKKNTLICACHYPINTLYGFLIGAKMFNC